MLPLALPSFADASPWSERVLCCVWLRLSDCSTSLTTRSMWLRTQPIVMQQLPEATGVRTVLEVPMLKDDDLVGAIVIYRKEVRRFDDRG